MQDYKPEAFALPSPETKQDLSKGGTLSETNTLPWQEGVKRETHETIGNQINNLTKMNEGMPSATAAADAIWSRGTGGMGKALSSRAQRMFQLGQKQNEVDLSNKNVHRRTREIQRIGAELNNIEKLKAINSEAQIRYADMIADYNNNLEIAKFQTLGAILGGYASIGGAVTGAGRQQSFSSYEDTSPRQNSRTSDTLSSRLGKRVEP